MYWVNVKHVPIKNNNVKKNKTYMSRGKQEWNCWSLFDIFGSRDIGGGGGRGGGGEGGEE